MKRTALVALTFALASLAASPARADTRAWAAAKKIFPAHLAWLGGARLDALRASKAFTTLGADALANGGSGPDLAQLKQVCGYDPTDVVDSVAVGVDADDHGAVVVALSGIDRDDVEGCLQRIGPATSTTISISHDGDTATYGDGSSQIRVRWIGDDVLAFATVPEDADLLAKMTAGGLASDRTLKPLLAKASTDAAIWGVLATSHATDFAHAPVTIAQAWGRIEVTPKTVSIDLHLVTTDAKAAAAAAAKERRELAQASAMETAPAAMRAVFGALKVKATGRELAFAGTVAGGDLLGFVRLMRGQRAAPE